MPLGVDAGRVVIRYVRTTASHLAYIHAQEAQGDDVAFMLAPTRILGFEYSVALTGFDGARCLGCAGLIELEDRVILWALLSKHAGPHFLEITRKARRVLNGYRHKALVACVRPGFVQGRRWMGLLGFKQTEQGVRIAGYPEGVVMDVYRREAQCPA